MKSLFARILIWFLATSAVTFGVMVVTTALSLNARPRGWLPPFARALPFTLTEARHAYETGGREALGRLLSRARQVYQAEVVLTDGEGHDLLTGEDRHALVERASQNPSLFTRVTLGRLVLGRSSEDGRYWLFLMVPVRRWGLWAILPQNVWVGGAVVLLCYLLALHLTSPLRSLQHAVERFGQGDLSARAETNRRDELGDLARTFNRMADRIRTLLEAERRLLLDISHELRSPLARLSVAVELARSGENHEAALDRIQKEADRLNELVGELLQVTRLEGDPSAMQTEPIRLDELVADLVEWNRIEAQARGCELRLMESAPVEVRGAPELLRRAIENVIRNAIRYAPRGTAVEVSVGGGSVRVRDYGPGVPPDALPRLFDAFYRVENDRNRASGGVGLGLSIARRAVELHKGTITAKNAGPGLEVEISLPANGSEAKPLPRAPHGAEQEHRVH